ncbi:class I SAM-dependent methyltransferase [Kaustia mangrovi]|uniref:Class I SAM-dependent methyltransferase n=1 Tax=Kaustia mangrovi TaxID=2593653 RepID=A0A7S8HDI2_9HYPH|nr:cyclopropane-fatty-acyl-phospholipid synthase family protein [Kaustia mangrovi]QPC44685.1 class I SAM-dependent methyltransferase [Kaustia mangrovi]
MFAILNRVLKLIVKTGSLTLIDVDGGRHQYGDGTGTPVTARITDRSVYWKLVVNSNFHLGEAYMDGGFVMEDGSIYDFLELCLSNMERHPAPEWINIPGALRYVTRRLQQFNPKGRSKRNVAHHYDLDGGLYDLFLDRDRQYSCAYFEAPDMSLDAAQLAKKRHLAAKLALKPGQRVLDIGSGWGGLGLYLAKTADVEVVGVTLSEEQYKLSNERAREAGLSDRVDFRLADYRSLKENFDRIVSVGMFEHVGVGHYRTFFNTARRLLADDGVAVVHSIGRSDGPGTTNPWIAKYIFPGGYIPALSEVVPVIERTGLYVTDVEILRLHYAETLRNWRRRFLDNRERAREIYDERFCRMWEFYLAASETAFRYQGMNNFQIQFARNQHALPITRDYMWHEEDRLRSLDSERNRPKSVPAE